jgi:hypothetical protein
MTDEATVPVTDRIVMGGTANLFTMSETHGIGAITGTIDGAAYGAPTSDLVDAGDGVVEFTGYHYFLDKDGSSLYTHDRSVMHLNPIGGANAFEVAYTVVEATGRFEGFGGTFRSRGWLKAGDPENPVAKHAVGMVRFEGELSRQ